MSDPSVKFDSPLGRLRIVTNATGLAQIAFSSRSDSQRLSREDPISIHKTDDEILQKTLSWLDAYFLQRLAIHSIPPLDLQGTAFQRLVWHHLCKIPWGKTLSYGEIARAIGHPKAVRAVGQACGANPIAIMVPCHRVLSAGLGLGGYAAGLERKRWLLAHEGAQARLPLD